MYSFVPGIWLVLSFVDFVGCCKLLEDLPCHVKRAQNNGPGKV